MNIQEVLDYHFGEKRHLYFQSSDAHKNIEGDTYLTYVKQRGDKVELYMGGNNGEICLTVTDNATLLNDLIKTLVYG